MNLIPENKKELLRKDFNDMLVDPVRIVMFTQEVECRFCSETRKLAQEMATLSDKITTEVYDFMTDGVKAENMASRGYLRWRLLVRRISVYASTVCRTVMNFKP